MIKNILIGVNLSLVVGLGIYCIMNNTRQKSAYVLNQRLFDGFTGKKELEAKITSLRADNKHKIDSLALLMEQKKNEPALIQYYSGIISGYELTEKQVSDQYTSDIWKRLNQYIADFGKEKNYDFIFGTSGYGNLMYASDVHDVTDDVIEYVNKRYEKGD